MSYSLRLVVSKRFSEALIEFKWNDGLRELIEVSAQNVRCIVHSVAGPVQAFTVAVGRVKRDLELLDALLAPSQPKNTLDISS